MAGFPPLLPRHRRYRPPINDVRDVQVKSSSAEDVSGDS